MAGQQICPECQSQHIVKHTDRWSCHICNAQFTAPKTQPQEQLGYFDTSFFEYEDNSPMHATVNYSQEEDAATTKLERLVKRIKTAMPAEQTRIKSTIQGICDKHDLNPERYLRGV